MIEGIILAAGMGIRMLPLTNDLPKPMLRINNKPVLEYAIELLKKNGIRNILITTYYQKEKIIEYFENGEKFGVNIKYLEQEKLNSSANAIKHVIDLIGDTVIIFNGDNLTNLDIRDLINFHELREAEITLCGYHKKDSFSGHLSFNSDGKLENFTEKISNEEIARIPMDKRFSSMGIYVFKKSILKNIPSDTTLNLGEFLPIFLKDGHKIFVYKKNEETYFKEVGELGRFNEAKIEVENGEIIL